MGEATAQPINRRIEPHIDGLRFAPPILRIQRDARRLSNIASK